MKMNLKDLKVTSFLTSERREIRGGNVDESMHIEECMAGGTAQGEPGCYDTDPDPNCPGGNFGQTMLQC